MHSQSDRDRDSVISKTDFALFRNIANPAKIDMKQGIHSQGSDILDIPPTTINGGRDDDSGGGGGGGGGGGYGHNNNDYDNNDERESRRGGHTRHNTRHHNHTHFSPTAHHPQHTRSPRSPRPHRSPSRSKSRSRSRETAPNRGYGDNRVNNTSFPTLPARNFNPFQQQNNHEHSHVPAFFDKPLLQPITAASARVSVFDQETEKYLQPQNYSNPHTNPNLNTNNPPSPPPSPPTSRPNSPQSVGSNRSSSNARIHRSRMERLRERLKRRNTSGSGHRQNRGFGNNKNRDNSMQRLGGGGGGGGNNKNRDMDDDNENIKQEKRRYLLQLEKLKMQGVRLTQDFTMNDDLADIRFEHDSHQSNFDVVDSVKMMKNMLVAGFVIIEAVNKKIGPILELHGWSQHMRENMSQFDRVLERFYHRFWKQGQSSPVMEFGMIIVGSMIVWHVQNKYLGGLNIMGIAGMASGNGGSGGGNHNNNNNTGGGGGLGGLGSLFQGGLGSIMSMFTGGQTHNQRPAQPPPNSQNQSHPQNTPLQPQSTQRPIPPNIQNPPMQQPNQRQNPPMQQYQSQQTPISQYQPPTQHPPNPQTQPQTQTTPLPSSVPPTATVAALPPMTVRGVRPPTRSLRRPSANLHITPPHAPLTPITESTQDEDLPSPP